LHGSLSALAKPGQNLITGFRGSDGPLPVGTSENLTWNVLSAGFRRGSWELFRRTEFV